MNKYQKEYIYRINRVVDYIENNLDNDLSLEKLADVANFSPFHFHRIFSAFMGETLNDFIKRIRVEKAASMLLTDKDRPISEVAELCGYNSLSVFCRNFKNHFKTSAQDFRNSWESENSKNGKTDSKTDKLNASSNEYVCDVKSSKTRRIVMKKNVEIKEMPAMNVIYCRHVGQFNLIGKAYEKLFKWAGPRGLIQFPETRTLTYYHDDPKVTNIEKLRQSACITVKSDVKTEGEIGKMTIPGGKYFVSHFEISAMEFQQAWDSACLWLSESGYQPADESPYELYHNNHEEHPEKKFVVDICIPIKPL